MSVNKVILLGRLGKDPETRTTPNGTVVTRFSLATSERRKDASGNWGEHTEWHNVVTFGKTAENVQKFLKKGREVFIEGKISTNKWQDKEGKDRYTTEIIAAGVTFVGGGQRTGDSGAGAGYGSSANNDTAGQPMAAAANAPTEVAFDDDDIPF
jgi:single-strand DNA-binding protein